MNSVFLSLISVSLSVCLSAARLLSLAVIVLQETLVPNTLERTLLRERVYNTALDYFT